MDQQFQPPQYPPQQGSPQQGFVQPQVIVASGACQHDVSASISTLGMVMTIVCCFFIFPCNFFFLLHRTQRCRKCGAIVAEGCCV